MRTELIKRNIGETLKLAFLMAIAFPILVSEAWGFSYRPETRLTIMSEYPSCGESVSISFRVWEVVPEVAPDGTYLLKFFPEAFGSVTSVCELKISPAGGVGQIEWQGIEKNRKKIMTEGLLIVPGFPAPCDILPVSGKEPDKTYEDRIEAGGRIFLKKYRAFWKAVSLEEARANGWLKKDIPKPAALQMITVVDGQEHLVVKQLWDANGTWWLYEETPLRRSWRMFGKERS
jgi:hypothetical protein